MSPTQPYGPGLGEYDPSRPDTVTFTADSPVHAEIMARALVDTLTRDHVQRLREQLAEGDGWPALMRELESPEGYQGMRLWLHRPQQHRSGRRLGWVMDGVWYDESLAQFLMRLPEIKPGTDHYGLPVPRPRVLFWDWAHRRPPVAEHPACSRPLRTIPGPDASLFEKLDHSIRWSREQLRKGTPSWRMLRWDQISDRLPDVWQLRAGMRARMPDEVADAVDDITEDRWRSLYEGQFRTPEPEPIQQELTERHRERKVWWDQDTRNDTRDRFGIHDLPARYGW